MTTVRSAGSRPSRRAVKSRGSTVPATVVPAPAPLAVKRPSSRSRRSSSGERNPDGLCSAWSSQRMMVSATSPASPTRPGATGGGAPPLAGARAHLGRVDVALHHPLAGQQGAVIGGEVVEAGPERHHAIGAGDGLRRERRRKGPEDADVEGGAPKPSLRLQRRGQRRTEPV